MNKEFEAAAKHLSGPKKSGKTRVHEVHVRRGHEGGYIARHDLRDEEGMPAQGPSPEYPIASHKDLMEHMMKHLPEESAEIAQESAGGSGEQDDAGE